MNLGRLGFRQCDESKAEYNSYRGKRAFMCTGKEAIMPVEHLPFKVTIALVYLW